MNEGVSDSIASAAPATGESPAPATPPAAPRHRAAGDWAAALVVTCLALGLVLGWGKYELDQRSSAESQTAIYRHDLDLLASRDGDLGSLLADPATRIIRLQSLDQRLSPLRLAAVAWNDGRQRGALFCDNLAPVSDGEEYQLWLIPEQGPTEATAISLSDPEPGETVYPFSPLGRAAPRRIVLTVGRPASILKEADTQVAFASVD